MNTAASPMDPPAVPVWTAAGWTYCWLGLRDDIAPGVISLPPEPPTDLGNGAVVAQAAFQDAAGRLTIGVPEELLTPHVRDRPRPPSALIHSATAARLGAVGEQYIRIRSVTDAEQLAAQRVQTRPYVLGALATNATVILALVLELTGWLKWAFAGATAVATTVLTVLLVRSQRRPP